MTTTPNDRSIHHGRNIKRFREMMSLKQEDLADRLGDDWSQKKVSQLENKEEVDDAILEQVARSLNITPEHLKNYSDEAVINYYNTFNESTGNFAGPNGTIEINLPEEWKKSLEENKRLLEKTEDLYERLLKSEQEKVALLEKMLDKK